MLCILTRRVVQLSSDCMVLMSADHFFEMIRPANFCTLSKYEMSCLQWVSCLQWGSHTAQQYSNYGRIAVLTIRWQTSVGAWCSFLWMMPSGCFTALQVVSMCTNQDRLEVRATPKYFTEGHGEIDGQRC